MMDERRRRQGGVAGYIDKGGKGQRLPTMSASVLNETRVSIRGETGMTSERRVENSS